MAYAREEHRHVMLVRSGNDFGVAHRSPRLNRSSGARFGCCDQSVRKWEEGIATDDASLQGQSRFASFPYRNATRINSAHLPCADPESSAGTSVHDRVGLNMLHHAPAEKE